MSKKIRVPVGDRGETIEGTVRADHVEIGPRAKDDPKRGPGFTITECWMFICVDETGAEGLVAANGIIGGQPVLMPLVATDEARRDSYYEMAVRIARMSRGTVRLIRLSHREELGTVWSPAASEGT